MVRVQSGEPKRTRTQSVNPMHPSCYSGISKIGISISPVIFSQKVLTLFCPRRGANVRNVLLEVIVSLPRIFVRTSLVVALIMDYL